MATTLNDLSSLPGTIWQRTNSICALWRKREEKGCRFQSPSKAGCNTTGQAAARTQTPGHWGRLHKIKPVSKPLVEEPLAGAGYWGG